MDDEVLGREQARRLRVTMVAAGIDRARLWSYYFGIGGEVSECEVDAYLHLSLVLPVLQRDLLAQAANEILTDLAPPRAPYAADLAEGHASPAQHVDMLEREDPGTPEDWDPGPPSPARPPPGVSGCSSNRDEGDGHDRVRNK